MAGEHTKEVQQAEIDRLNDSNDKEEREAAREQEDLKKHQDNMKENLKLDHEREMEKERLKHQKHQRKPSSLTVNSITMRNLGPKTGGTDL